MAGVRDEKILLKEAEDAVKLREKTLGEKRSTFERWFKEREEELRFQVAQLDKSKKDFDKERIELTATLRESETREQRMMEQLVAEGKTHANVQDLKNLMKKHYEVNAQYLHYRSLHEPMFTVQPIMELWLNELYPNLRSTDERLKHLIQEEILDSDNGLAKSAKESISTPYSKWKKLLRREFGLGDELDENCFEDDKQAEHVVQILLTHRFDELFANTSPVPIEQKLPKKGIIMLAPRPRLDAMALVVIRLQSLKARCHKKDTLLEIQCYADDGMEGATLGEGTSQYSKKNFVKHLLFRR